jgi:hypothetical protein
MPYNAALHRCYHAARCLDAGVTFVSERQLLAGKGAAFKLLILPACKHMPKAVFEALDTYVQSGGTVVLAPESLTADEYNRPADYLARWGITVTETLTPTVEGYGEARQKYDQNIEREIRYGGSLRQLAAGGEVVETGCDGKAALLRVSRGAGTVWFLTETPAEDAFTALLDRLYSEAGVYRPVRVTDGQGRRAKHIEARLARRKFDDLVYVSNEGAEPAAFRFETDRPYTRIREMRSLKYYKHPEGVLEPDQVLLFSLQVDPTTGSRCCDPGV